MEKITRDYLIYCFVSRSPFVFRGHRGIIQSLEHEDGSGYSFNVVMQTEEGRNLKIYIRTTPR